MKIVVIGGTGLIGSRLVDKLTGQGHEAVPASLESGVDIVTGEGLADTVADADVVVDVSNSPSFEDQAVLDFFTTSTSNLMKAERAAGVGHHVALSVVGTERLGDSGYMRAKVVQERLIKEAGLPYSIVHATQFFEFVDSIANASTVDGKVCLPPVDFQPIAADDVAGALARVAIGDPLNGNKEVAGPQKLRLDEFVRSLLMRRGDPREVVTDDQARYFGAQLQKHTLVPGPDAELAATRYEDWAHARAGGVEIGSGAAPAVRQQ